MEFIITKVDGEYGIEETDTPTLGSYSTREAAEEALKAVENTHKLNYDVIDPTKNQDCVEADRTENNKKTIRSYRLKN